MQVAQQADPNAFAIIGGGRTGRFEIAQSAHMVQILSETLYPNKKKAVVREYLCNAVDAHRMNGREDEFIEVTLTKSEFKVVDRGPGIPHDQIVPVFCTYGGSTKTDDAGQIGGFGLGCKAGFAVADHFTVINCHGGRRVVYAITKGTPASGGMPDFRIMVDTPCKETGLTVVIPIEADGSDLQNWKTLVQTFTVHGGFKVRLNGSEIEDVFDFTGIERSGLALVPEQFLDNRIYCRYGNILYPVRVNAELEDVIHQTHGNLGGTGFKLVVDAPPHSVSVVPSREDLSYDEKTLELVAKRLDEFNRRFKPHCTQVRAEILKKAMREQLTRDTWGAVPLRPNVDDDVTNRVHVGIAQMARATVLRQLRSDYNYKLVDHFLARKVFPGRWLPVRAFERAWGLGFALDYHSRLIRRLLRIQRDFPKIAICVNDPTNYHSNGKTGVPLKRFNIQRSPADNIIKVGVVVAETKTLGLSMSNKGDFIVATGRMGDDEVARLKAMFKRMKFGKEVKYALPQPRVAKGKKSDKGFTRMVAYKTFHNSNGSRVMFLEGTEAYGPRQKGYWGYKNKRPEDVPPMEHAGPPIRTTEPKAFFAYNAVRGSKKDDERFSVYIPDNSNYFVRDYKQPMGIQTDLEAVCGGDVAIACFKEEYAELEAMGVPMVEEILLDLAEQRLASEDESFCMAFHMMQRSRLGPADYGRGKGDVTMDFYTNILRSAPELILHALGYDEDTIEGITKEQDFLVMLYRHCPNMTTSAVPRIQDRLLAIKERSAKLLDTPYKIGEARSKVLRGFMRDEHFKPISDMIRSLNILLGTFTGRDKSVEHVAASKEIFTRLTKKEPFVSISAPKTPRTKGRNTRMVA